MNKNVLSFILFFMVFSLFGQQCDWVKTVKGVWQGHSALGDHYLQADSSGNVYTWGSTANFQLVSPDFSYSAAVSFVASYSQNGSFRWIRTYSSMTDVDVDRAGYVYILTHDTWYKLDALGQQLFSKAIGGMASIKSSAENCYLVSGDGEIQKFDKNGNFVASRLTTPRFTRVLREYAGELHVLGTYNGNNVKLDGIALEPTGDPCNCTGAFYAILDENLKAICARATTGSATKSGMDAAFVTSGGNYVNARGQAYDASELYYGNCISGQLWKAKADVYLNNSYRAFADAGNDFLAAHSAYAEPSGTRFTLFRYGANGELREAMAWENLTAGGVASHPEALYICGFVIDTTTIDHFTLTPYPDYEPAFFIAKLKPSTVDLKEQNATFLRVAPNPFHEVTSISVPESFGEIESVTLHDTNGRLMPVETGRHGSTVEITRNGVADGIYLCTLIGKNGSAIRTKLLVQ